MQIKFIGLGALMVALFVSTPVYAVINMVAINGGDIKASNDVANNTLLKTIPLNLPLVIQSQSVAFDVLSASTLWNPQRGIYQSTIPGIGFSLCSNEGENCLIPSAKNSVLGSGYSLRLYKIGDLKGGDYSPGTLLELSNSAFKVQINLLHLIVHNMSCTVTKNNLEVTFPDTTLSKGKEKLAEMKFSLPVTCHNPDDYHNVMVAFSYADKRYDDVTMATNLSGLGIRLHDTAGKSINFSQQTPDTFQDMHFVASLVRIPGKQVEAGQINVSATATITMR